MVERAGITEGIEVTELVTKGAESAESALSESAVVAEAKFMELDLEVGLISLLVS